MTDRDPLDPASQGPFEPEQGPEQPPAAPPTYAPDPYPPPAPPLGPTAATPGGEPGVAAKPDVTKRAIAAIVDGAIAGALGLVPAVGWIASVLYVLLRDGFDFEFMDGRSVGKKLMNLRPVRLDGGKMDFATSAKRNWTICLGSLASFLLIVPVLGWLLYVPVMIAAAVLGIIEIVRVFTDAEGRRLGDTLAGTKVVEVAD